MPNFFRLIILILALLSGLSFARDYQDTVYVTDNTSRCDSRAKACLVVRRGCFEQAYSLYKSVDKNSSQEELLAMVYGSEPLPDSAKLYDDWAGACYSHGRNTAELRSFSLGFLAYGAPATVLGILFVSLDSDDDALRASAKSVGVPLLITGGLSLALSLFGLATLGDSPKEAFEQASRYGKRNKGPKMHILPFFNFENPGGGVLMDMNF